MIIDAHQHFWDLSRRDYAWLTPAEGILYRNYLPTDLIPTLRENGVIATVLVQAAPSEAETRYLFDLARANPFVAGVIGWVDFEAPDVERRIGGLIEAGGGMLKGLRPMIQDIADPEWVRRATLDRAFEAMSTHGLVFDALVRPVHLPPLRTRLERHPQLRVVLDHAAKPQIKPGEFEKWAREIQAIGGGTQVHCKLSGLLTLAAGSAHPSKDIEPYVEHMFACFGPQRVLWGSDWPVLNAVSEYSQWLRISKDLIERFAEESRDDVLGGNAQRVYRLKMPAA
jgi:L-fuconolactonase